MKIFNGIPRFVQTFEKPVAIAIGMFDGVHIGHVHLIEMMKNCKTKIIFTFINHPIEVVNPRIIIKSITSLECKLKLLEQLGIDLCIIKQFDEEIENTPYTLFIEELHNKIQFDHIFFGEFAAIGKNREGSEENIKKLGLKMNFTPHYIKKIYFNGTKVSSTNIRKLLADGDLKTAKKLLGLHSSQSVWHEGQSNG